jgi:hypothetical protein
MTPPATASCQCLSRASEVDIPSTIAINHCFGIRVAAEVVHHTVNMNLAIGDHPRDLGWIPFISI